MTDNVLNIDLEELKLQGEKHYNEVIKPFLDEHGISESEYDEFLKRNIASIDEHVWDTIRKSLNNCSSCNSHAKESYFAGNCDSGYEVICTNETCSHHKCKWFTDTKAEAIEKWNSDHV